MNERLKLGSRKQAANVWMRVFPTASIHARALPPMPRSRAQITAALRRFTPIFA
jgi:hypothetical protein